MALRSGCESSGSSGWKSLKYVDRIELVDHYRRLGDGKGSFVADEYDFQWYGGV